MTLNLKKMIFLVNTYKNKTYFKKRANKTQTQLND
jgi:hypothetical protein